MGLGLHQENIYVVQSLVDVSDCSDNIVYFSISLFIEISFQNQGNIQNLDCFKIEAYLSILTLKILVGSTELSVETSEVV